MLDGNSPECYLRRVTSLEDFDEYFSIKSEPGAVAWSGFSHAPDKESLCAHFKKLISDPNVYMYFYCDATVCEVIGYVQLNAENDSIINWAGYSFKRNFQGKAYNRRFTMLLLQTVRALGFKKITGWISEKNYASIRWNTGFGSVKTDQSKTMYLHALGREDIFYLYELVL